MLSTRGQATEIFFTSLRYQEAEVPPSHQGVRFVLPQPKMPSLSRRALPLLLAILIVPPAATLSLFARQEALPYPQCSGTEPVFNIADPFASCASCSPAPLGGLNGTSCPAACCEYVPPHASRKSLQTQFVYCLIGGWYVRPLFPPRFLSASDVFSAVCARASHHRSAPMRRRS